MASGFNLALPSVITSLITGNKNNTDIYATKEQAAWFTASYGMTGPIGFIILPALMQKYGRKITSILMNLAFFIGSVIIALASNVSMLIVGRAISGFSFAGLLVCCVIIAEYTHPKRRGTFILLKNATASVGQLLCHVLALKMTWQQLAWFSAVPAALAILMTACLPESPSWFAYVGRYEDCTKSFEYIRGTDKDSNKELKSLIIAQKELKRTSSDYGTSFLQTFKSFRSKEFLKPLLIVTTLIFLYQALGGYFLMAYLIEIMMQLTGDRSKAFYFSIACDVMKLAANLTVAFVIIMINRRTLLFVLSSIACIVLGFICIFSYLTTLEILHPNWSAALLLVMYMSFKGTTISVIMTIKSEIVPLQYRGLGNSVIGIIMSITATFCLKLTSNMLQVLNVHGMLGIYLIICIFILILLYFILPETKDKTLQDIENLFTGIKSFITDISHETESSVPLNSVKEVIPENNIK